MRTTSARWRTGAAAGTRRRHDAARLACAERAGNIDGDEPGIQERRRDPEGLHRRDGKNVSPPLAWTGAPATTKEFALILDDPDANFGGRGPFVHWVIYKIPGTAKGLPGGGADGRQRHRTRTSPARSTACQGSTRSSARARRRSSPAIAVRRRRAGTPHHYHFTVYALNAPLDVKEGLDKAALLKAMEGKIVAQGEIVGVYQR